MKNNLDNKVIKPDFYDTFNCIADKCTFTCCKEWNIAVDDTTMKKWQRLGIRRFTKFTENMRSIRLNDKKVCPYLTDRGLCSIVLGYGEEMISNTCHIFPRQEQKYSINESDTYIEKSLVSCCPEVIDIISKLKEISFNTDMYSYRPEYGYLNNVRSYGMHIINNNRYTVDNALKAIFYMLDEMSKSKQPKETVKDYFNEENIERLMSVVNEEYADSYDAFIEKNELFLDVTVNYIKKGMYSEYLNSIVDRANSIDYANLDVYTDKYKEYEKELINYNRLIKNYMILELYTNLLLPDSDIKDVQVKLQWITMTYETIKQAIFLRWLSDEEKTLEYRVIRDYVIVISRIMGFSDEDIAEYMEESFETSIWSMKYMILVTS